MGESYEYLLKAIRHYQEGLDKYTENRNDSKLLHYLEKLYKLPIKVLHLEQTGVGRTVNSLRKLEGDVGDSAKSLVAKWKEMVVGEAAAEEEDDDEEDEEDEDDEDGYQSGEGGHSNESEEDEEEEEAISEKNSSHKSSDHRTEKSKEKHLSSSSKTEEKRHSHHHSESSKSKHSSKKERHEHSKSHNNGHSAKPEKRKESSDSEVEFTKNHKKAKREEEKQDKSGKSKRKYGSDSDNESRRKKHRDAESDGKIKIKNKHRDNSLSGTREKSRDKDKPKKEEPSSSKKESKKNDHIKKGKDHDKESKERKEKDKKPSGSSSSKSKDSHKEYKTKDAHKKSKSHKTTAIVAIDSGSGASFAEALGMCEPSSSKSSATRKKLSSSHERKEKTNKPEDSVPKLLKESNLEPIDLNLSSLLPTITPNYRPLGSLLPSDAHKRNFLSENEALCNVMTSKNQRTKVYSGNKVVYGKVPSLFEMCIRVLQDNIDALEYTGGVPYSVLKPILDKANPNQLFVLEHHNPYLIEDTDDLWQLHCQKDFRAKPRQELESWREMYMRCLDEREAKLKALTANIKQSQDKSLPVRTTKLAYVDDVAKPPRNIARKQAKNGTAFDKRPAITPTSRLQSIATSGEAGKVAVPNPGARAMERSGGQIMKPKKAPLMMKSLSLLKNRFRR